MDYNGVTPTKELMQDLTNHLGWKWVEGWIKAKQDGLKESLLRAKDMDEVKKLQTEYDVYSTLLSKIKSLCGKGQ
jgi:hypothetical protein